MIDIFQLYDEFCGMVNTTQNGQVRPVRHFEKWVNTVSLDIFMEQYRQFEKEQFISDEMYIFLRSVNVRVKSIPGQMYDLVKLAEDYKYFASARLRVLGGRAAFLEGCKIIDSDGKECQVDDEEERKAAQLAIDSQILEVGVKKVTNNRWDGVCGRRALGPSLKNPYCTQFDGGLKIAPKGLGLIIIDYFRMPAPAKFAYTLINPGAPDEYFQYDKENSQPVEWGETMKGEILSRLEKIYYQKTPKQ